MASAHGDNEPSTNGVNKKMGEPANANANADAVKSPTTSVKQLLADTSLAPPTLSTATQGLREQKTSSINLAGVDNVQKTNVEGKTIPMNHDGAASSVKAQPPTFQQTLADLRAFLLPFLKLLPFQSLQAHLKTLIGPLVRFCVRVTAKLLHRSGFGLASNIAFDTHILFWRWIINLFFREIRPRGGWRAPKQGA